MTRAESTLALFEAAIAAGWKLDDVLAFVPKAVEIVHGPAPIIDEAFSRKLDSALNETAAASCAVAAQAGSVTPIPALPANRPLGWWATDGHSLLQEYAEAGYSMQEVADLWNLSRWTIKERAAEFKVIFDGKRGPKFGNTTSARNLPQPASDHQVGEAAPAAATTAATDTEDGHHVSEPRQIDCSAAGALNGQQQPAPAAIPERKPRGWWLGPGRVLLQAEADAKHTMAEAAIALRSTYSQIAVAAHHLKIRFNGCRGHSGRRQKVGKSALKPGTPAISIPRRGPRRRFTDKPALDPENVSGLPAHHIAVTGGHTLFPTTVVDAADVDRVLISGGHSRKLGDRIVKGRWADMPIFTLTLEERATCPRSCAVWNRCYGNGMPLARRHDFNPTLITKLEIELAILNERHEKGFAVRLHNLGDFPTVDYAVQWVDWLIRFDRLHVFGYTAHAPSDGATQSLPSTIGAVIEAANRHHRDRWFIRFSVPAAHVGAGRVTTIWRKPEGDRVPEGIVCPAQTGKTDCCGACGLCWEPNADKESIVFVGHGPKWTGRSPAPVQLDHVAANKAAAKLLPPDAAGPRKIKVEALETREVLPKPVQRRCEGCRAFFSTRMVDQTLCVACMKLGKKPRIILERMGV